MKLRRCVGLALLALAVAGTSEIQAATPQVTFYPIATDAYGTGDINACAVGINSVTTAGNYQFAAYYDVNRNVIVARRQLGSSTWQTFDSGFAIASNEITDDHNVIAIAVDSAGYMHMSWNMHNVSLNYAVSTTPVLASTLNTLSFSKKTAANAPSLFPSSSATTNSVTYPQFYTIPNSNQLLFTYRNGGAGGGSGNGNQYVNLYNPATGTWNQTFVVNGIQTSVNGYLNTMAFDSSGDLMMSWTWRASPDWRTNTNIMFAQSPNNGQSWYKQGGSTAYTLPIIQSGSPASSVGQVIKYLPQGSGLINQTSMTVDKNDRPMIATWWAPEWTPTAYNAGSGVPDRQYMLVYYDGTQWRTSQISHRTTDTAFDTSSAQVRDLGRPIVLVDDDNRVLVVMRYEDTGIHSNGGTNYPAGAPGNNIVVAYTDDLMHGNVISDWNYLTLDTANMGSWEPTFDRNLWETQNKLALLYEPVGLSGETSGTVSVLEWDEKAFFAVPEPASLGLLGLGTLVLLCRRR